MDRTARHACVVSKLGPHACKQPHRTSFIGADDSSGDMGYGRLHRARLTLRVETLIGLILRRACVLTPHTPRSRKLVLTPTIFFSVRTFSLLGEKGEGVVFSRPLGPYKGPIQWVADIKKTYH